MTKTYGWSYAIWRNGICARLNIGVSLSAYLKAGHKLRLLMKRAWIMFGSLAIRLDQRLVVMRFRFGLFKTCVDLFSLVLGGFFADDGRFQY